MAKKTNRVLIGFQCSECNTSNYTFSKNKINVTEKISLNKFCKNCKKYKIHKEKAKLK